MIHLVSQRARISVSSSRKSTRNTVLFSGTHTGHRVKVELIVLLSIAYSPKLRDLIESTLRARRGQSTVIITIKTKLIWQINYERILTFKSPEIKGTSVHSPTSFLVPTLVIPL